MVKESLKELLKLSLLAIVSLALSGVFGFGCYYSVQQMILGQHLFNTVLGNIGITLFLGGASLTLASGGLGLMFSDIPDAIKDVYFDIADAHKNKKEKKQQNKKHYSNSNNFKKDSQQNSYGDSYSQSNKLEVDYIKSEPDFDFFNKAGENNNYKKTHRKHSKNDEKEY